MFCAMHILEALFFLLAETLKVRATRSFFFFFFEYEVEGEKNTSFTYVTSCTSVGAWSGTHVPCVTVTRPQPPSQW